MNRKVPIIAYLLFKYGFFAKPFLNMILEEKIPISWKYYFKSQKLEWKNEFKKALSEIEKGLKTCENNLTLYYILLSEKILFLRNLQDSKADEYFKKLRRDFAKIPSLARKISAPTLLNYFATKYKELDIQRIRFWSKEYKLDRYTEAFLLFSKAEIEIKKKNLRRAISLYFESYKIAKKIPHPIGIIANLNNSSWYLKEKHPKISLNLAKKALYFSFLYKEEIESMFFVLDTLLESQKITKDLSIFETINIINSVEKNLPHGKGWGTREHYKNTIEFAKKFSIDIRRKTYENSEEIREYLENLIKDKKITEITEIIGITKENLSFLLRGKTKKIKDETIRKFIEKFNIFFDLSSPLPFLTEHIKRDIEEKFHGNLKKFLSLLEEERELLFISTYMGFLRGKNFYLARKNRLKTLFKLLSNPQDFIFFIERDYELMRFFNEMLNSDSLYSARKELSLSFLKKIPNKRRKEFIEFYINSEEEKRKLIDSFSRNYIRYDRKWETTPRAIKELEEFIKKFRLKKIPTFLSIYALDKKIEREKLIQLLKSI